MTLRDGRGAPSSGTASLHADALAVLRAWTPPSAGAGRSCATGTSRTSSRHRTGSGVTCYPDHLTASTLVLSADGRRVLLTLHAKAQRWFQLGGHCEPR